MSPESLPYDKRRNPFPILSFLVFPFFKHFIKEVKGLENFPKDQGCILAINHIGYTFDGLFLIAAIAPYIKKKIHFIAVKNKHWQFFGDWLPTKWLGLIPFDPENKAKCLDQSKDYLKQGGIIGIFPEGIKNLDPHKLLKGKTGAARLALWCQAPVVTIGFKGALAGQESVTKSLKTLFSHKPEIEINIGQPMTFEEYYDKEINHDLLNEVTRKIMVKLGEMSGKKYTY